MKGPAIEGWYLDPDNSRVERYWDGTSWTSETRQSSVLLQAIPEPFGYRASSQTGAPADRSADDEEAQDDLLTELVELMHEQVALQYRVFYKLESINTFMWFFAIFFTVPTLAALIALIVIGNGIT